MKDIKLGKYKHYKGNQYEVIAIGKHTETVEDLVVYKSLLDDEKFGNNAIWIRPKKMFLENVIVNNTETPRFEYLEK